MSDMDDPVPGERPPLPGAGQRVRMPRLLVLFSGGALLGVMGTDFIAVIGRHVGLPLLGSIEIVQALVLIAAAGAMLATTIAGTHAVVHLLAERVSPATRDLLARFNDALSALFFLALTGASIWLAWDMIGGHEESELLRIPYAPLRIVLILACFAIACIFAGRVLRARR